MCRRYADRRDHRGRRPRLDIPVSQTETEVEEIGEVAQSTPQKRKMTNRKVKKNVDVVDVPIAVSDGPLTKKVRYHLKVVRARTHTSLVHVVREDGQV